MTWSTDVVAPVLSFITGAGGTELFRFWRARARDDAENHRDIAAAADSVADAAAKLIAPYVTEVTQLRQEVADLKTEMTNSRSLLQQAITVIRDFLAIAREHSWPTPHMSKELLAEIDKAE